MRGSSNWRNTSSAVSPLKNIESILGLIRSRSHSYEQFELLIHHDDGLSRWQPKLVTHGGKCLIVIIRRLENVDQGVSVTAHNSL